MNAATEIHLACLSTRYGWRGRETRDGPPPDKTISADDGPIGSGASYRTLSVTGQRSILEHHPLTGFSISVKAGNKGTLTLESNIAAEEEMISAAEVLITEILREDKAEEQK